MVLSVQTKTFQNLYRDVSENMPSFKTRKDVNAFISERGVDPEEFLTTAKEYEQRVAEGETEFRAGAFDIGEGDIGYVPDETIEGTLGSAYRTTGRAVGEVYRGAKELGKAILPEDVTNYISNLADEVQQELPKSVVDGLAEFLDPYHGETMQGTAEDLIGTIGAYIVPGTLAMKAGRGVLATSKALSPGVRSLTRKAAVNLGRASKSNALNKALLTGTSLAGKGAVYTVGATIVERPEDNIVNAIISFSPESEDILSAYAVNPDDTYLEQKVQQLINNVSGGVATGALAGAVLKPAVIGAAYATKYGAKGAGSVLKGVSSITGKAVAPVADFLPERIRNIPASFKFNMTADRGTDATMRELRLIRDKKVEADVIRHEGLAKNLIATINKEYSNPVEARELANSVLLGETPITSLKGETANIVKEMISNRKAMQKSITSGAEGEARVAGKLADTITESGDVYLTRSYKTYNSPLYRAKRRAQLNKYIRTGKDEEGTITAAIDSLQKTIKNADGTSISKDEAVGIIDDLFNKTSEAKGFLKNKVDPLDGLIVQSNKINATKVGKERNLKQEALRTLLGEEKDPVYNYLTTISKLSEIQAEKEFIQGVADHVMSIGGKRLKGREAGMVELGEAARDRAKLIFGKDVVGSKEFVNPLDKVYFSPEYKKFLEQGFEQMDPSKIDGFFKAFLMVKGATQLTKTILSVPTHFVNMMGNQILMSANGMFVPGANMAGAIKTSAGRLTGLSNKELSKRYGRLVELNVANSGVGVNVLRNRLNLIANNTDDFLKTKGRFFNPKYYIRKAADVYQAEDDIFKIAHFENTIDYLKKTSKYKNKNLKDPKVIDELEREAAQRTQDLMPNYGLVPNAIKSLRGAAVGDFMSFPAEMTRITKNLVKYTLDDITSGDDELFKQGAKRLAGLTIAGTAPTIFEKYSMHVNGITEEQNERLNTIVEPWNYRGDKIYLSPIAKDERGSKGTDVFWMGRIDPFNFVRQGAKLAHGMVLSNDTDETKIDKGAINMLEQVAAPFLGPSMITDALLDTYSQIKGVSYQPQEPEITAQLMQYLTPLAQVLKPGTMDFLQKRAQYEKSKSMRGEYDLPPIKNGIVSFSEGEVDNLALAGLKRQRIDIQGSIPYVLRDSMNKINNSGKLFDRAIKDFAVGKPGLTETGQILYGDGVKSREQYYLDDIRPRYIDSQKSRIEGFQELRSILDDYRVLLGDDYRREFYNGLSRYGKSMPSKQDSQIIESAFRNIYVPYNMDLNAIERLEYLPPIDFQDINNIRNAYSGTRIDDNDDLR